jgi:hypothetical protein
LKYYIEKAGDVALELLHIGEGELALSMLKTVEEDLGTLEADPTMLYFRYRVQYNIAHM